MGIITKIGEVKKSSNGKTYRPLLVDGVWCNWFDDTPSIEEVKCGDEADVVEKGGFHNVKSVRSNSGKSGSINQNQETTVREEVFMDGEEIQDRRSLDILRGQMINASVTLCASAYPGQLVSPETVFKLAKELYLEAIKQKVLEW